MSRFCVRRRAKESEVVDQDGRVPRSTADPWTGNWQTDGGGARGSVDEDAPMGPEPVGDGNGVAPEQPQVAPGAMASPRLIPAPESPRNGEDPVAPPPQNFMGDPSASYDNKCAPSQAPIMEGSRYDHLTYDELRNLCRSRRMPGQC